MELLQLGRVGILVRGQDRAGLNLAMLVELLYVDGDGECLDVRAVILWIKVPFS